MKHIAGCIGKEKKRNIVHREARGRRAWVLRMRLTKSHIMLNAQAMTNRIPTAIALVLITVAKENTLN